MSRGGFKVERNGVNSAYEYDRSEPCPDWLSRFADEYAQTESKTAVEVMRERDEQSSIFERMNTIMNGAPTSPYSSVEEAVTDYQKRTGLVEYQKLAIAQEIIDAGNSEDAEKKTPELETPELLKTNPQIGTFISNVLDTQYGIQLPAILHGIMEMFGREVRESDLDSPDLVRYINQLVQSKNRKPYDSSDISIGRGIGTETEVYELNDPNRDPFIGLMPKRMV